MMKRLRSVILFVLALGFVACGDQDPLDSSQVDANDIHKAYMVSYDEISHEANIAAKFSKGTLDGPPISLASPSRIDVQDSDFRLDGVPPIENRGGRTTYSWSLKGSPSNLQVKFLWTKHSREVDETVVAVPLPIVPKTSSWTMKRTTGGDIDLEDAVQSGHKGILTIAGIGLIDGQQLERQIEFTSGRYVTVKASDLSPYKSGVLQARIFSVDDRSNIEGGKTTLTGLYLGSEFKINLMD